MPNSIRSERPLSRKPSRARTRSLKKNKKGGSVDDSGKGKVDANENLKNGDRLPEHLKWDEANLYLTEQEKNATMKITEPKTPYQGTIGSSEYYHDDDGEDIPPLDDDPEGGLLWANQKFLPITILLSKTLVY